MREVSSPAEQTRASAATGPRRRPLVEFGGRLVREKPLGALGGVVVLVFLFTGIFAPLLAPDGVNEPHPSDRLSPPSAQYILGTDTLGRDMLSRVIYGARISMVVGVFATLLSVAVSLLIGIPSAFLGGKYDILMQRFVDAWMCFPDILILITIMSIVGPGIGQVIVIVGLHMGITTSRVIRGAVLGIKQQVYVQAADAIGCRLWRIFTRHLLPNIMPAVLIIVSIRMGSVILLEATLSFLGFGVPPPEPSWGGMLSRTGRKYLFLAPGLALWPGLALGAVIYGVNMFGDAVRDLLDPRLRGGAGSYAGMETKRTAILAGKAAVQK